MLKMKAVTFLQFLFCFPFTSGASKHMQEAKAWICQRKAKTTITFPLFLVHPRAQSPNEQKKSYPLPTEFNIYDKPTISTPLCYSVFAVSCFSLIPKYCLHTYFANTATV